MELEPHRPLPQALRLGKSRSLHLLPILHALGYRRSLHSQLPLLRQDNLRRLMQHQALLHRWLCTRLQLPAWHLAAVQQRRLLLVQLLVPRLLLFHQHPLPSPPQPAAARLLSLHPLLSLPLQLLLPSLPSQYPQQYLSPRRRSS